MDKIVSWCGEPLADMPRERLVEIISALDSENRQLSDELLQSKLARVRDVSDMGRRLRRAKMGWVLRLLAPEPA